MKMPSLLLLAALASPLAFAEMANTPAATPAALADQIHDGRWPAEIVRAADECLNRFPGSTCAGEAASVRPAALRAAQALAAREVTLCRTALSDQRLGGEAQGDVHLAALGDARAAARIAALYPHGSDASLADQHRYVSWLQYAAQLGDDVASYDLALHFRSSGQPAIAAVWETRAAQLGYVAPVALDHIRK